jgi:hypothetical protein
MSVGRGKLVLNYQFEGATVSVFETTKFLIEFLMENPGRQYKSIDVARAIIEKYPQEAEQKRATSVRDLSGENLEIQVQAEISSRRSYLLKKYPEFTSTDGRPSLYSWNMDNSASGEKPSESVRLNDSSEHSLYPKLALFLESIGVHAMRIDEKTSSGKRGAGSNHWRHPDLAAIEYMPTDWETRTQALGKHYQSSLLKFWSFEVKVGLSISNVRESFFQTVSNSSWANFAYLVAGTIDARAREELELLSATHGIGVIVLNEQEPVDSEVILPAQERGSLDWSSVDRLVSENRDFAKFIEYASLVADAKTVSVVIPEFQKSVGNLVFNHSRLG